MQKAQVCVKITDFGKTRKLAKHNSTTPRRIHTNSKNSKINDECKPLTKHMNQMCEHAYVIHNKNTRYVGMHNTSASYVQLPHGAYIRMQARFGWVWSFARVASRWILHCENQAPVSGYIRVSGLLCVGWMKPASGIGFHARTLHQNTSASWAAQQGQCRASGFVCVDSRWTLHQNAC